MLGAWVYGTGYGIGIGISWVSVITLVTASVGLGPIKATRPIAPLINGRNFAVVIGFAIGAYATLYYVTEYGLTLALTFGAMCVLGSLCSSSYIRYLIAACFGRIQGLPFRFAGFLAWCHSAGILRVSGLGYQFRHQELLDYLLTSQ
jgi:hypothetical protein